MTRYRFIILVLALMTGATPPVLAGDSDAKESSASFYIPEAQRRFSEEQGCVEPTDEMRANHMEYILDQRDATMYEGIRTPQYSLVECIDCHVSDAPDAPRADSEKHFCSSCHTYTGVSIDCFQCHADRPVKTTFFHPLSGDKHHHAGISLKAGELTPEQLQIIATEAPGNE